MNEELKLIDYRLTQIEGKMKKLDDLEIRMAKISLVIGILGVLGGSAAAALVKFFVGGN